MTVSRARGAKGRADVLFSKIVRARGTCEYCGSRQKLECAHIKSRSYANTRCNAENAFCLCSSCHRYFHANPDEFGAFVALNRDPETLEYLRRLAHSGKKVDWPAVADRLRAEWKSMNS